jgi:hypothetical protein
MTAKKYLKFAPGDTIREVQPFWAQIQVGK